MREVLGSFGHEDSFSTLVHHVERDAPIFILPQWALQGRPDQRHADLTSSAAQGPVRRIGPVAWSQKSNFRQRGTNLAQYFNELTHNLQPSIRTNTCDVSSGARQTCCEAVSKWIVDQTHNRNFVRLCL